MKQQLKTNGMKNKVKNYNELIYDGTTYRFKKRLVCTSEGNFEDYDIMINGNKSEYELSLVWDELIPNGTKKIVYILNRNGFGTGAEFKNPTSLIGMAEIVSMIIYYEGLKIREKELEQNKNK